MVGHQNIGMDAATCLARIFLQPFEVEAVVFFGVKTDLAVVATLDDVERDAGEKQAGSAGHG